MDRSPNHVNLLLGRNMELWGDQGAQTINVPTLASSQVRTITVMFNDFVQWP
ncbi:MAG: hypothetical protein MUP15_07300 [Dehalococcoidia bacterium]|nr:hypothetical protein [Dehalococcoidia bacterium]